MLLLCSTSDLVRVVTDASCSVDVQASYVDLDAGAATPARTNTAITTATTTTVVPSPSGTAKRNVKLLSIRNKHASTSVGVTVEHTDGSTAVELIKLTLGAGQSAVFNEGTWFSQSTAVTPDRAWESKAIACFAPTDPGVALRELQRAGNVAATPTNIGTSTARCSLFRPRRDITVDSIYVYGVGATTNVFRCAIYRYSDLARLTSETAFSTSANTWGVVTSGLNLSLSAGVLYFMACSVNAIGTTAGPACLGGTVAATTGQIATAPDSLPNNLAPSLGYLDGYFFQFAVTTGALPNPAATLAAQSAWTGGMPAFFLTTL